MTSLHVVRREGDALCTGRLLFGSPCSSDEHRAVVWTEEGVGFCGRHAEEWNAQLASNEKESRS